MGKATRRKTRIVEPPESDDPLGELMKVYTTNIKVKAFIYIPFAILGAGMLFYALIQRTETIPNIVIGVSGGVLFFLNSVFMGCQLWNVGKQLELHRRGVRLSRFGMKKDMRWKQIVQIEVVRTAVGTEALGLIDTTTVSDDEHSPVKGDGLHVTIHDVDGRTIELGHSFMQIVDDPIKLIANLRKGAKLTKDMERYAGQGML
jgi:hypothetical protein